MSVTTIYHMRPIADDPRYEGFAFEREDSLRGKATLADDFMPDNIPSLGRKWTVTRIAPVWTPQSVEGRVRPYNDFPCIDLLVPAFSRRAVDVLGEYLVANGELLPLITTVGEYYAFNVTTVADILNIKRSQINWIDDDHVIAYDIERYEFLEKALAGLTIFRLVEDPASAYVTDEFVDRVTKNHLNGFCFVKVWPFPIGTSWKKEELKLRRALATTRNKKEIKGNTVVIILSIAGRKTTKKDKRRIVEIEDDLDALLVSKHLADPYYGTLEGTDYVEGEYRLFLSCPDAGLLVDKLYFWLQGLTWDGQVTVLKRYGELHNPDAQEEIVELPKN